MDRPGRKLVPFSPVIVRMPSMFLLVPRMLLLVNRSANSLRRLSFFLDQLLLPVFEFRQSLRVFQCNRFIEYRVRRFGFSFHIIVAHDKKGFFELPERRTPIPSIIEAS